MFVIYQSDLQNPSLRAEIPIRTSVLRNHLFTLNKAHIGIRAFKPMEYRQGAASELTDKQLTACRMVVALGGAVAQNRFAILYDIRRLAVECYTGINQLPLMFAQCIYIPAEAEPSHQRRAN